jgi:hypothetical protein
MKRLMIGAAAAAGAFAALGGTAFAAPTQGPNANVIPVDCGPAGQFLVAVPSGGKSNNSRSLTPGIIVEGGSGVIVTTSLSFGGPPVISRAGGNPNVTALTCSSPAFGGITVTGFQAPGSVSHNP